MLKCKCLHAEHVTKDAQYTMGGTVQDTEKDLRLTIITDKKVSE